MKGYVAMKIFPDAPLLLLLLADHQEGNYRLSTNSRQSWLLDWKSHRTRRKWHSTEKPEKFYAHFSGYLDSSKTKYSSSSRYLEWLKSNWIGIVCETGNILKCFLTNMTVLTVRQKRVLWWFFRSFLYAIRCKSRLIYWDNVWERVGSKWARYHGILILVFLWRGNVCSSPLERQGHIRLPNYVLGHTPPRSACVRMGFCIEILSHPSDFSTRLLLLLLSL